jgi:hypothetical protein
MEQMLARGNNFQTILKGMSRDVEDEVPRPPADLVFWARKYRSGGRAGRRFFVPWTKSIYDLRCSDLRDKIYSQLTFSVSLIRIEPDYDKSIQSLRLDIVIQCQGQMELNDVDCLARLLLKDRVEDQPHYLTHDWHPIDHTKLRRGSTLLQM